MTRAEYLNKLQEQMEKFGNELRQEIMEDYSRHFAEGAAAGRTDEEIIEELGNIEDMIRELKYVEVEAQPDEGVEGAGQDKGDNAAQGCGEGGDAAQDGGSVGQTGDAAQDGGNVGQDEEAEQLSVPGDEISTGDFKSIVLKTGVADIVLVQSEDEAVHVDYRNDGSQEDKMKYEFYQYEKDGVFYAGVRRNKNYNDGKQRSFSIGPTTITFRNNFHIHAGARNADIILIARVPKKIPEVRLETSSGDIEVSKLTLKKVKATTGSGDVAVAESILEKLEITTASGDIEISEVTVEKQDFTTASGDIQMKGVKSCKANFVTASGDVSCEEAAAEKIDVKTASGDIRMRADAGQYHLVTVSGDINLHTAMPAEKVELNTVSGDIDFVMKAVEGAEVKVNSRSGDIVIDQNGDRVNAKSGNTYIFGDGACKVSASTVSGDIAVAL